MMNNLMFSNLLETIERMIPVAAICFVIWLAYKNNVHGKRVSEKQIDLFGKVADKFGAAEDFLGFLRSNEGRVMLHDTAPPRKVEGRSQIRFIQVGIMLAVIGIALLLNAHDYLAILLLSVSVGLFIVSYVTILWERKTKDKIDS